jgi:broad-specificity NMP kinase
VKRLFLIGGTMGIGKTATAEALAALLPRNVLLDGDWCWKMSPFAVTEETKRMVMENITFLLGQFLECSAYENVIFCWVMHEQSIIDEILLRLPTDGVTVLPISLVGTPETLKSHLTGDIEKGIRHADVIERSLAYLPKYEGLQTVKIDVTGLTAEEVAQKISALVRA